MIKEHREDDTLHKLTEQATMANAMAATQSKDPAGVAKKLNEEANKMRKEQNRDRYVQRKTLDQQGKVMSEEDQKKMESIFGKQRTKNE